MEKLSSLLSAAGVAGPQQHQLVQWAFMSPYGVSPQTWNSVLFYVLKDLNFENHSNFALVQEIRRRILGSIVAAKVLARIAGIHPHGIDGNFGEGELNSTISTEVQFLPFEHYAIFNGGGPKYVRRLLEVKSRSMYNLQIIQAFQLDVSVAHNTLSIIQSLCSRN